MTPSVCVCAFVYVRVDIVRVCECVFLYANAVSVGSVFYG